ncbi:MAG: IPExxxVDY family protein [Chitinophagales bacterium]|nr:IPExxxVDY family protein [Chitinophagales bacterium]
MAEKKIKNELDTDYAVIGIATPAKEYKLCYHLNRLLVCDFNKVRDLIFESTDRTRSSQFSVFKGISENGQTEYWVYANKNAGEVLLPEAGNFDFLLRVSGYTEEGFLKNMLEEIRQLPEVLLTTEIPLKKIKNKERLVYVEETTSRKPVIKRHDL